MTQGEEDVVVCVCVCASDARLLREDCILLYRRRHSNDTGCGGFGCVCVCVCVCVCCAGSLGRTASCCTGGGTQMTG